jgi:glycosyltransferase involved in cell wall biosynthesis
VNTIELPEKLKNKKVVILHDWLTGFRGGERVLEAICELFPDAPIYTLIHDKGSTSPTIESREIHTSFLDKIPGIYLHYRKFLPFMPLAASMLKIKGDYDLVISSSHCVIKGVKKPKGSRHVCYIHSPMRYIYDQFENYFGHASLPIRIAAHICRPYLAWWDKRSNKNVDLFLPNSKFVEKRVHKYYGTNVPTKVVHPFVDLDDFKEIQANPPQKEDFYLMVTAFAPNKRVDLAIEAFNELGLPLKIIGGGSEEEVASLRSIAKSNIEFLGKLSREDVISHYARAKAFIFPGVEDFGITPLEANAAGTALIAYGYGGVLETQDTKTAKFFTVPNANEIIKCIEKGNIKFDNKALIDKARSFSKYKFQKILLKLLENI